MKEIKLSDHLYRRLIQRGIIPRWVSYSLAKSFVNQHVLRAIAEEDSKYDDKAKKIHSPNITIVAKGRVGMTAYIRK